MTNEASKTDTTDRAALLASEQARPEYGTPAYDGGPNAIKIRDEFAVHRLNDEGMARAKDLGKLFTVFLNNLESQCGAGGREMAIVKTKLQEAAFFAKRAIAVVPENQEK